MKKVNFLYLRSQLSFLLLVFLLTFSTNLHSQEESADSVGDVAAGEALFKSNCAACHKMDAKAVGPALRGVADKFEREWLYDWIRNSQAMVAAGDPIAVKLFEENNKMIMTPFPALSDADIDNILAYTSQPKAQPVASAAGAEGVAASGGGDSVSNDLVLGALALIFILLVIMLFLVYGTLKRIAAANGVDTVTDPNKVPLWKAFAQNQFLVIVVSVFFLLAGSYFAFGYLMQVGVDQGYQPVQPIHFSHKIHAGDNGVDCNFCHSSARKSKTSGIPSLNVCMSCHKNISEVAEETATDEYSKEFYDGEIAKLYQAVGWDVDEQQYTGETEPVKWVRIHNLPDFAYFNHSQHVSVAGISCQTCHGEVQEMEVVEQFSPLTMGWCIDCHRETNVNLASNEYYAKIHEELSKKYGVEKLTIAEMGGLECGKCHY
ncbi:c-type cytochrome [Aequorivita viscosa]|uniref:Quinol:cytochrome c oxidoreductase pentaheme cytochrome subunit n=1 Tax=Aequorivita viscosa TaxID=797419 RepID=A0A1M6AGT3_9FLAO|nr:c-type cytochrome [Aequorivita viscosa]SDW15404.1 quinol:cytochrome c oxidoreductase pentaheme cytochrome subunit [Aequorivita viscosa]SHI35433.1 quinol:cytochrome c oxidoreductase pentaheme cytochrome subunit [Aequorivita viscosa]